MTLEEKKDYIISLIQDDANVMKLIKKNIEVNLATFPEAKIDMVIAVLTAE